MRSRIKEVMEASGLTPYGLAKRVGIAPNTARRLVGNPNLLPDIHTLVALCDYFEVQPGELLVWLPEQTIDNTPDSF